MSGHALRHIAVVMWALLLVGCGRAKGPSADEHGPVTFDNIKTIRLAAARNEAEAAYLGISADASGFALTDVKSKVLLVQLFDMYCMNCQRQAPEVNRLYDLVQSSDLKDRVRFVGIGKGNTEIEASIFRERYDVKFPLFSDPEKLNTKRLGESRTPYFVIIDMKTRKVAHQQWMLSTTEGFLEKLRNVAEWR